MRNPFRSEADAFRLVLLSLGYFGLIVVAAAINRWLGLAVFVALTTIAVVALIRARREPSGLVTTIRRSDPGERRILVIANETVGGEALRDAIARRAEGVEERVRVVCPALMSPMRYFGADEVIISTHPEGKSVWLERGVVRAARERFDVPITHVVVDLAAERDEVRR